MAPWYDNFDSYVADHPDGEHCRAWLTDRKLGVPIAGPSQKKTNQPIGFDVRQPPLRIVKGVGPHNGIEGGYLWATAGVRMLDTFKGYMGGWSFFVYISDCDDGLIVKMVDDWNDVLVELDTLCELAPLSMWDLVEAFDYQWDM